MPVLPFFKKDYVRISYDDSAHIIIHEWLIPPTEEEFKAGCEQLIEAMLHFKTGKVVVDTRGQGVLVPELMEWMTTDWAPRGAAAGYSHGAIILPTDVFTQLSVDEIMETVSELGVSRNFDDMENAIDWIRSQ